MSTQNDTPSEPTVQGQLEQHVRAHPNDLIANCVLDIYRRSILAPLNKPEPCGNRACVACYAWPVSIMDYPLHCVTTGEVVP